MGKIMSQKFTFVSLLLLILCINAIIASETQDSLSETAKFLRTKRSPQGGFSPFSPKVQTTKSPVRPTTATTRRTTTTIRTRPPLTTTRKSAQIANVKPRDNRKPLASLKIKWYKSESNRSLWSSNCDFTGKSQQLSPEKFEDCVKLCERRQDCTHYIWAPLRKGTCWLRSGPVDDSKAFHRKAPGLRCGYVPPPVEGGIDWKDRNWAFNCDFYDSNFETGETASEDCETLCAETESCTHYSWVYLSDGKGLCGLKAGNTSKEDAFYTEEKNTLCGILARDSDGPNEPFWHIIIGGKNVEDLASVEAFNWKTKEQCFLSDFPIGLRIHSGTVLHNVSMICGGFSLGVPQSGCYKYIEEQDSWEAAADLLMATASGAASVQVPKRGWYIFGGDGATITRSQRLNLTDGDWELGPDFYKSKLSTGECLVQLNDTTTVFLGGSVDNRAIVLFSWVSRTYTKTRERLINKRWKSACALMKNSNGDPLVAIAGGIHQDGKGMEIWSPTDGTVKLVSTLLPTETKKSLGLNHASLVPIKGGRELLLYGGYQGDYQSDIWRFVEKSSTWVREGSMQLAREEQVVLPVENVRCKAPESSRSLLELF